MTALMKNKKILLIVAAALVVAGVVTAVLLLGREDAFRTIQIYRLDGTAELRRGERMMEPYVNMALRSGDHVATREESYLYLKMDSDKFMLAEPLTRFSLTAAGNERDSRTRIDLEEGAVTSHITEPLSASSSYEVTTPNSTMAVRGTSFRVLVWFDENGVSHTLLMVFEGTVGCRLRYPDGTFSEERLFTDGQWASIWGNSMTSAYDEGQWASIWGSDATFEFDSTGFSGEIDYLLLDIPTLEFLKIGVQDLEKYDITAQKIDEIIRLKLTFFDVRFTVNGQLFGTQSIQFDHFASEPSLRPAPSGAWDFDFGTPIREETEIRWSW